MTLLNAAKAVYAGGTAAAAVYQGNQKVWPSAPPVDESMPPVTDGLMIFLDAEAAVTNAEGYVTAWPDLSGRGDHPRVRTLEGPGLRVDRVTPTGKKSLRDANFPTSWAKGTIIDWDHAMNTTAGHLFFVCGNQQGDQSCLFSIGPGDDSYWWGHNGVMEGGVPVADNFGSSWRESNDAKFNGMAGIPGVKREDWYVGQTFAAPNIRGFKANNVNLYTGPASATTYWSDRPSFFEAKSWSPGLRGECAAIVWYNRVLTGAEQQAVHDWLRRRYISDQPPAPLPFELPAVVQTRMGQVPTTDPAGKVLRITSKSGGTLIGSSLIAAIDCGGTESISAVRDSAGNQWKRLGSYFESANNFRNFEIWGTFNTATKVSWVEIVPAGTGSNGGMRAGWVELTGTTRLEGAVSTGSYTHKSGSPYRTGSLDSHGPGLIISAMLFSAASYPTLNIQFPFTHCGSTTTGTGQIFAIGVYPTSAAGIYQAGAVWTGEYSGRVTGFTVGPAG